MPASLAGYQRDPWHNAGAKYFKSGVTRGTTSSSGVISVDTLFPREVDFAWAYDESTHIRIVQTGGGPAQTMSTYLLFTPITPSGTTARFRVLRFKASGDNNATFTLASSLSAVSFKWAALGF